jgi:toxin-antitoxin system PIN domain toxin
MVMPDVNILTASHLANLPHHVAARSWLQQQLVAPAAFGISDLALTGFVRIVTGRGLPVTPTTTDDALDFCDRIRRRSNCALIRPGSAHWMIFDQLCRQTKASGKLIPDAWFAALAIENGCTWVTMDGDYARFPGLTWRHFPSAAVLTNAP